MSHHPKMIVEAEYLVYGFDAEQGEAGAVGEREPNVGVTQKDCLRLDPQRPVDPVDFQDAGILGIANQSEEL
jgi:hypothetical protein